MKTYVKIDNDVISQVLILNKQNKGTDASNLIYEYLDKLNLSHDLHDEIMMNPHMFVDPDPVLKLQIE